MKYFKVDSTSPKTTTFSCVMSKKNNKAVIQGVTIAGMIPKPNPAQQEPAVSYISEAEKTALEKLADFNYFVEEKNFYRIKEILFEALPEEKQKEYDKKAYARLQASKAS